MGVKHVTCLLNQPEKNEKMLLLEQVARVSVKIESFCNE
jgi:hypothetical protein